MVRRPLNWLVRHSGRWIVGLALRRGGQTAVDSALSVVPKTAQRSHVQVFNVKPPVTVYVRASHCRITVCREPEPKVILDANLYRAFGVELTAEQDDAGVYIVAKRKAVVGRVTRIDLALTVPANSQLALHLTPGDVIFEGVDGMLELPMNEIFPTKA
jgi:hypothetical protein